jgi:FlaA1/EpsC-like NDP-sugar epimerase
MPDAKQGGPAVCVTGAGGYIGSALVKALARTGARSLILLDSSEYALFEIARYMDATHPAVSWEAVLGSVGDNRLLESIFTRVRPDIVFHAAAFKHVALLERNPFGAISNNVLGSYTLSKAALRHGVSKVLLVSTDKAVRPHSVMGVSKRIAELLTLSLSGPACAANAVRLGNVIGSRGSVIPLFLEQIEKGLPLSVTHPEASRYFLSIKETVTAILAAASTACEGKILLPELGEPVRIAELARILGPASPIRLMGLQPGEKVSEDLIGPDEAPAGIVDGPLTVLNTRTLSRDQCDHAVKRLSACVERGDVGSLLEALLWLVPEYKPSALMEQSAEIVPH